MRLTLKMLNSGNAFVRRSLAPRGFGLLAALLILGVGLLTPRPLAAQRPERPTLDITGYVIDAEIDPATHHLSAKATVTFTAPDNSEIVSFGFHPALKVYLEITDESGKGPHRRTLGRRNYPRHAGFTVGRQPAGSLDDVEYDGTITGSEDGPVEGCEASAAIQEPITYLLYPARWFPTTGYMTDRFTAEVHFRVPQGMKVFSSGAQGSAHSVTLADKKPGDQFDFNWTKPGFPGTIIAGRFVGPISVGSGNVKVYLTVAHQGSANQLAQTATREFDFFTDKFGGLESSHLNGAR